MTTNLENEALIRAAISQKLQQGMAECSDNPLVPKAFHRRVQSRALNQTIAEIVALARTPLEESIQGQQDQILHLQEEVGTLQGQLKQVQRLETLLDRLERTVQSERTDGAEIPNRRRG